MKICNDNPIKEIKNIVQEKAKYQKVMVLFDENVSNIETQAIYQEIKDICILSLSFLIKHIISHTLLIFLPIFALC